MATLKWESFETNSYKIIIAIRKFSNWRIVRKSDGARTDLMDASLDLKSYKKIKRDYRNSAEIFNEECAKFDFYPDSEGN